MLASITPLGERGRNNRFALTATAYAVGATLGGLDPRGGGRRGGLAASVLRPHGGGVGVALVALAAVGADLSAGTPAPLRSTVR